MSIDLRPVPSFVVPESAPFSVEQRAWLSGFLAAAVAPHAAAATALAPAEAGALIDSGAVAGPVLASNDEAPWHDPALALDARMGLAEGRPLAPRLMAAMAQQDCGQCGYTCAAYANALFLKTEQRLNLCAPGGKDTARMVRKLAEELTAAPAGGTAAPPVQAETPAGLPGRSREMPVAVRFLTRRKLSGAGSQKDTWHVEFDLAGSGLDYRAGDAFGVFPRNDPGLVDQIIALLGASHGTPVRGRTLRAVLADEVSLGLAPDSLHELFSFLLGGEARKKARALAQGEDPDGDAKSLDVMAVLTKFPQARPHPEAFVDALEPLQPRLYSISSSPRTEAGRLSLTVDAVRYVIGKRRRLGVGSTYLAERAEPGEQIRVYVQAAHNFALPADPTLPVIMVGPGTGVAPFRAFLQDRAATGAPGKTWLFYGHQHLATDFYYRDELETLKDNKVLSRLSLAWSRDGTDKFYVQDRMREVGAELWQWLAEGAHLYICGDAKRMAKDVEAALVEIVAAWGVRSTDEAIAFVSGLKKSGRFQADVY